jgi:dolichyl-phosphate beta-glucosyltransferase
MPEVCLVIPCYNEARRFAGEAVLSFLRASPHRHVCLVNDGSADNTSQMIDALKAGEPGRIQTLHLERNGGKGDAVRQGVLHVAATGRFDVIGYWDADLSAPFDQLEPLLAALLSEPRCLLVMGSRIKRLGSAIERRTSRHVVGRVFATVASFVLDLPVYDSQCGAKVFRASIASVLFREPFTTRWLFDVEMLARLRNHLGKEGVLNAVVELPLLKWRHVDGSKLRLSHMGSTPVGLFRIHRRYNRT